MHVAYQPPRLPRPHSPLRVLFFLALVALAITVAFNAAINIQRSDEPKFEQVTFHGRWKELRRELGLPALPDTAIFPVRERLDSDGLHSGVHDRFQLGRKRALAKNPWNAPPVELKLAPDALDQKAFTMDEIKQIFENEIEKSNNRHLDKYSSHKNVGSVTKPTRKGDYRRVFSKDG
ncbi:hypothetical protein DL96DRAFT_1703590 [Flagelloscypha sp. PMI_526]|nr:hypothetical protein DL96DRAFT_1703590 [Flagelloscypha sp. PMI_526]